MNQFLIEKASRYDVPATVARITEAASKHEWQNPATHNLQNSLAKAGQSVRPVQVIEICKPKFSGKMLELSDERIFSVMMPCRISVYEKEDGKTYVSILDASGMTVGMPPAVAEAMTSASKESLAIVEEALD